MTTNGFNNHHARDFTEGDLGTSRYNEAVAAPGDRDAAFYRGLGGSTMIPGRARPGFERAAADWQNFHRGTEDVNDHADDLGELHAGQLHRLNRAARGEISGRGRVVPMASSTPRNETVYPHLGAAERGRRDWGEGMRVISGASRQRTPGASIPAPVAPRASIPAPAPRAVAAPVPSPVPSPVVASDPEKKKEKPAESKAPTAKVPGLMASKWAN
ncbi:hypothetical protein BU16DRAFT_565706 [Lophium mytilinum]|uniref:Uncharacterized protein n=1 Tax=Lophium mytilinum TaxID=390894 RepID=A0A6A6QF23_9PEZI|nr:hypothetical protein BU16DRAFT_565706 [Lophium mytilinum]